MKLTVAAELAVRGVLILAERFGTGPVPLARICELRDLPREYMTKIFASLARADLISAIRGKHGGYRLARPPADILLLEIIEAKDPSR